MARWSNIWRVTPGTVGPGAQLNANRASRILAAMDTAAITAYIKLNPQGRFGKPVVKGTRTTVAEVLEMLANGMSAADIAENFPTIAAAQVRACLLYAAYRESIVLQSAA